MTISKKSLLLAICFFPLAIEFTGCVPASELPPGSVPGLSGSASVANIEDVDPTATSLVNGIHFTVKGYTDYDVQPVATMAESLYGKIGNDFGIYSDLAAGKYTITLYHDRNEYLAKTHQPSWSRAVSTSSGVYTYPGTDLEPYMAHEVALLAFSNFMGDRASAFQWLGEGIAVYEEVSRMNAGDLSAFTSSQQQNMHSNKQPLSLLVFSPPPSEENRRTDPWFQESESVVAYLLQQGTTTNFKNLLIALKQGADIDHALSDNYPVKFHSLSELENAWKTTIQ